MVDDSLLDLFNKYGSDLPQYQWASETERWMELLLCLTDQTIKESDLNNVREALQMCWRLDLIEPAHLVTHDLNSRGTQTILLVLERHGLSLDQAQQTLKLWIKAAEMVEQHYGGKLQLALRKHAENLRQELCEMFAGLELTPDRLRFAMTLWLQNVVSAPLSLEQPSLAAFCEENDAKLESLFMAADKLNVNVAVLDDLIELGQRTKDASEGTHG